MPVFPIIEFYGISIANWTFQKSKKSEMNDNAIEHYNFFKLQKNFSIFSGKGAVNSLLTS